MMSKLSTFFLIVVLALSALGTSQAEAAPAAVTFSASASVTPQIQYLNDTAGTVFTFTIHNTGTASSIGAVEIDRPSNQWTIVACPLAPTGWSATRSDAMCRYKRADWSTNTIMPGTSNSNFQVKATTTPGNADRAGTWKVTVSKSNQFDNPSLLSPANAEPPGLGITVYSWQILDAIVDGSPNTAGSACPAATAANHSAITGSTGHTIVICGKNRMNVAGTPQAARSSLGGTFIASVAGSFTSGAIAANSASSIVLGKWSNVTVTSTSGTGKTIITKTGSAVNQNSPLTTLNGYEAKNKPPVAVNDNYSVDEDTTLSVTAPGVLSNDSDPDGDPITAVPAAGPSHGSLTLNANGSLTYTPAANYNGPDSFTYKAQDTFGAQSAAATVNITVNAVNDAPVASGQSVSTNEDTPKSITLSASDVDGNALSFSIVTGPSNGSLGAIGSPNCASGTCTASVTYTPNANYFGSDSFTFKVNDGSVDSNTATVNITVSSVDDAPVAVNDSATVNEDSGATSIDVLANDTDVDGGPKSINSVTQPANGSVVITGGGTGLTYQPNANYCNNPPGTSPDTFTYTLTPGGSSATVSVTVNCVDDAPLAVNDSTTVLEDASATAIDVLANDTDVDGGPKSINSVTQPANGSVVITGGGTGLTYQPNANYCTASSDTFTYTLSPGGSTATVSVTVTCVNDAPSFNLPATPNQAVVQDSPAQTVASFATNISAGPSNESSQTLTFHVSNNNNSLFSAQPDIDETTGDLTYTPAAGQTGTATVSVYLTDNGGIANSGSDTSPTQTFTISVNPPNAVPSVDPATFSVAENSANGTVVGTVSANDPDAGQTLSFSITAGNSGGAFAINASTGQITVADSAALDFETNPTFSLTVQATDNGTPQMSNSAIITVNLTNVNEQPTDIALSNSSVAENQSSGTTVGTFSTSDPDAGDTFTYTLVSGTGSTDNASFQITGNTLQTNAVFDFETKSSYSIRVRSTDSGSLFTEKVFTISITNVNEQPTDIALSNSSVAENQPSGSSVGTFSTTDPDAGDTFTYSLVSGVGDTDNGSFQISGSALQTSAVFDFEIKSSYSIRVQSTDSGGAFFVKVFTISVTNVNEQPTDLSLSAASVDENQPSGTTVGTFSTTDPDSGDTFTYSLATGTGDTDNASFQITGNTLQTNAVFDYEAKNSYSIRVRSTDSGSLFTEKQFTITINDLNEPPLLNNIEGGALSYTENDPATAITSTLTVSDQDSPMLSGATVSITNNFQAGSDVLAFTDQLGITGSFNSGTGVLTLTGSASPADYQTALRTVTFANTSENPVNGAHTVTFKVNDGTSDSNTQSRDVSVTAVNDAPVNTVPGSQAVNEDTDLVFSSANSNALSVVDVDAASNNIQVTVSALNGTITPASGSGATIGGSGTSSVTITGNLTQVNAALNGLKYKGSADYNSTRGAETLTIVTNDQGFSGSGGALSDTDTVGITVNAVNDPPTAAAKSFTVQANMKISGLSGLLTGATDPDSGDGGYTATFAVNDVVLDTCTGGTISNLNAAAGTFDFDPQAGVSGSCTLKYRLNDSGNPGPAATSAYATITLTINGPVIWFVNNAVAGPGTGTLADPFKTLASADAVDAANHRIFLYQGTYANGIALNSGEWLIGQGATNPAPNNNFDALFGITPPAGTIARPTIGAGTATIQNTVTLASSVVLKGLTISSTTNQGIVGSGGLTGVDVSQASITTTTATALSLNNVAGSLTFTAVSVTGSPTSAATGIDLTNVGATVSIGSGTIQNTTTTGVSINGGAGNFSQTFSSLSNTTGRTILVQNRTGGTVTFGGTINGGGTGILLNSNTGSTINFTAGVALTLSTGPNAAFTATGGGTVNVTGNNTLTTTTGTALNVTNTTIGSSGLTFRSISANGAANGIVLNNTGNTAGLTVTGDGNTSTGGNDSGGIIQFISGAGISLTSTLNPSFTNMNIHDIAQNGIDGTGVTNFTFKNGKIVNAGTAGAGQYDENLISFNDSGAFTTNTISGGVTITGNTFTQPRRNGLDLETGSGTITNLVISNNNFSGGTTTGSILHAILVLAQGSASTNAHITTGKIQNNTISGFENLSGSPAIYTGGSGIFVAGGSGSSSNGTVSTLGTVANPIEISGNDVDNVGSNGIAVSFNGQNGISNFNIHDNGTAANPMSNMEGLGISVFFGGSGTFSAVVNNNAIDNNGPTVNAGSSGIGVQLDDGPAGLANATGLATITVNNNLVTNPDGVGIRGIVRNSNGTLNLKIQNNDVGTPSAANRNAIRVDSGSSLGNTTLCLNMSGNTGISSGNLTGSGVNQGIGVRKQGTVTTTNFFGINGITANPTNVQVQSYLAGLNTTTGVDVLSGSGYMTCSLP